MVLYQCGSILKNNVWFSVKAKYVSSEHEFGIEKKMDDVFLHSVDIN